MNKVEKKYTEILERKFALISSISRIANDVVRQNRLLNKYILELENLNTRESQYPPLDGLDFSPLIRRTLSLAKLVLKDIDNAKIDKE